METTPNSDTIAVVAAVVNTDKPEVVVETKVDAPVEDKPKKTRAKRMTAKEKLQKANDLKKEAIDEMNKEAEEANGNSVSLHVANLVSRGMSMKDATEKAKG